MSDLLDPIPVPAGSQDRVSRIVSSFVERFGVPPEFLVRAPGRVNLIGEHIDYCGFPVLPIAIEQDVTIAGRTDKDSRKFTIANTNSDQFTDHSCDINSIEFGDKVHWYSYVLAGFLGVTARINRYNPGLQLMVDGEVPMSAGLSSSSALVCASALSAAVFIEDRSLDRSSLAELCARSERYVGTQGGGMDQAISFLAVEGKAQLIDFNPVRCSPVSLPAGVTFVVANSMVNKWKADSNDFNNRVTECRLATKVLSVTLGHGKETATLHDLMNKMSWDPATLEKSVEDNIKQEPYTTDEIKDLLNCSDEEWQGWAGRSDLSTFRLYDRATHVAGEAARVTRFHKLCITDIPNLKELGALIDESHFSLKDKYNVSVEELDDLTQICRDAGALGSRLVGAGFGGCSVSMVHSDKVEEFIEKVYQGFYGHLTREDVMGTYLFATKPSAGAAVLQM